MKNRIYTIIACFLATVIYSCSDVLNQAPDGKISLEEVFGDNDKTMYYLNTCYSGINAKGCLKTILDAQVMQDMAHIKRRAVGKYGFGHR